MEIISFNNINLYEICWSISLFFRIKWTWSTYIHTITLWSGKFESRTIIDFIISSCKKRQCIRRSTIFIPFFLLMQKVSSFFYLPACVCDYGQIRKMMKLAKNELQYFSTWKLLKSKKPLNFLINLRTNSLL